MIVKVRLGCSVAVTGVLLALPAIAPADEPGGLGVSRNEPENAEPPSRPRNWDVELGAQATYTSPPIRGGTSPFGAGFGARVGVNVSGFYAAIGALYYLGGSDVTLSDRALLYGLDVGYGFRVQPVSWAWFTLRPLVGVGDAAISHTDPSLAKVDVVTTASGRSSSSTSDTITVNNVYLRPGITAMLSSSTNYVALTGNVLIVPGISYGGSSEPTTWFSYGVQGELGFRF